MEESYHVAPNWASGVKKAVVEAGVSGPNTIGGVLRDATSTWVDIERDDGTLIRLQPAPYLNAKDGNYKIEYEKNGDALWMMGLPLPTAISAEAAEHVKQVNANVKTVDDAEWPGRVQYDVVPNAARERAAASQDSDDDYDVIDDDAASAAAALGEAVAAQGSPFAEDDSDDYSVIDDMDYESDEEGAATAAAALGEAVAAQGSPFAEDDSDEESDEESDDESDEEYEDEDGGEDFEVPLSDVAQRFPDPMEGMSPAQRNTAAALRDEHHLHPKVIFPADWFDRTAFEQKRMINMHQNKQTLLTQGILSHRISRMLYLDPVDPHPPDAQAQARIHGTRA